MCEADSELETACKPYSLTCKDELKKFTTILYNVSYVSSMDHNKEID